MQVAQDSAQRPAATNRDFQALSAIAKSPYSEFKMIRRSGAVVAFEPGKIAVAMTKAFLAVNGSQGAASARVRELAAGLTDRVVDALKKERNYFQALVIEYRGNRCIE